MNRGIINFDKNVLDTIHNNSLELLHDTGIRFPSEQALEIFKKNGFRTDSDMVFFEENYIQKALETVPAAVTIKVHWGRARLSY